jgi:hypothetical protein
MNTTRNDNVQGNTQMLSYDTVVFAGGGTPGIAYAGCMNALDAANAVDFFSSKCTLQTYIGTSVGALFAILACCQINPPHDELVALVAGFCRSLKWTAEYVVSHACLGLNDGSKCIAFLDDLLYDKFGCRSMTFADLKPRVGGRKLVLVATNVADGAPVYFSHTTHPDASVSAAAFASMCIPLLFEPCVVRYLRGGPAAAYTAEAAVRGGALLASYDDEAAAAAATTSSTSTVTTASATTATCGDVGTPLQVQQTFVDGNNRQMEVVDIDASARIVYAREVVTLTCVDGCFCNNNALSLTDKGARVLNLRINRQTGFVAPNHVSAIPGYVAHLFSLLVGRIDYLSNNSVNNNNVKNQADLAQGPCVDVIEIDAGNVAPADFSIQEDEVARILQVGDSAAAVFILGQCLQQNKLKPEKTTALATPATQSKSATAAEAAAAAAADNHDEVHTESLQTHVEKQDAAVDCDRAACSQPVRVVKVSAKQWVNGVLHPPSQAPLQNKGGMLWQRVKAHHHASSLHGSSSALFSKTEKRVAKSKSSYKGGAHDVLSHFLADLVVNKKSATRT